MGSRSRSSSSSHYQTTNYALQGDNSGQAIMGNNNTLISTDHGAIDSAFDFGETSLKEAFGFGAQTFDGALSAVSELSQAQNKQNDKSIKAIRDLAENVQTNGERVVAQSSKEMMTMVMSVVGLAVIVAGTVFWRQSS